MPEKNNPLYELRCQIDELDNELLDVLSRRYKILDNVVKVKSENNIPFCVPSRVEEVLNRNAEKGARLGLPENYVRDIWNRIIDEAHTYESGILTTKQSALTTKNTKDTKSFFSKDELSAKVVDAIFNIHKKLGPGLLESAYEECLGFELLNRDIPFERQKLLPLNYDGHDIKMGYRLDMVVDNQIILELKVSEKILPVHQAQLLTYMKLSSIKHGFIVNFNVPLIKDGIKKMVL